MIQLKRGALFPLPQQCLNKTLEASDLLTFSDFRHILVFDHGGGDCLGSAVKAIRTGGVILTSGMVFQV